MALAVVTRWEAIYARVANNGVDMDCGGVVASNIKVCVSIVHGNGDWAFCLRISNILPWFDQNQLQ